MRILSYPLSFLRETERKELYPLPILKDTERMESYPLPAKGGTPPILRGERRAEEFLLCQSFKFAQLFVMLSSF